MVIQRLIQIISGLHQSYYIFLVSVLYDAFIHSERSFCHCSMRTQWIQHNAHSTLIQFLLCKQRRLPEFRDIGQNGYLSSQCLVELIVRFQICQRFGKQHICSADTHVLLASLEQSIKAFICISIGSRHHHKLAVNVALFGCLGGDPQAVQHFVHVYNRFVRSVSTALVAVFLVFYMTRCCSVFDESFNGSFDRERVAESCVDVN
mmetsp:Transcript_50796/g.80915  ORF Transcript_50796/g.80915 Transcript_50796/m.80915 type:complete len:205 (-) Transcript_50796:267-881(-)